MTGSTRPSGCRAADLVKLCGSIIATGFSKSATVFVIGNPVSAYIALSEDHFITSLYCAQPGAGRGKALLDYAKGLRPRLSLWTFVANTGARRFYVRESFVELRRTAGENEENLPDLLYRWDAS